MSKMRSHTTINGTAIARSHRARAYQDERAQRSAVEEMLAKQAAKASFDTAAVTKRLDEAYERDKAATERRQANRPPPLDLGD